MKFIKKYSVFILVLLSILLCSCSDKDQFDQSEELSWETADDGLDELQGVWIETEYETYEQETMNIRVKWYNTLFDNMTFGEFFILEKNVGGTWIKVSKVTDIQYGFIAIGYILSPNQARWHEYNLIPYTDGLTTGEYRISATFSRDSLDGEDYGPGNYPNYQVYGYFMVGEESIERSMHVLDTTKIEYLNKEYHFAIYLPKTWEGFHVITEQETGDRETDDLFHAIDDGFIVIKIRHPQWSIEEPYQDIALAMFRQEEWNKNVNTATNDNFDLLPDMVSGGGQKYVLTIDPTAYNKTYKEYEEVIDLLGNDYSNSSIRDY